MNQLYPIKFKPIIKDKIWGGTKMANLLKKDQGKLKNIGESWELSDVKGELSVAENGFLKDNTIEELIEVYMGDLVGDSVYETYGLDFPLLFKFIEADDYLSIQVHPDDELAWERHQSFGKTEMWYIVDAEPNAKLIAGFNCPMDKEKYIRHFNDGSLRDILNWETVKPGDVFFIPAGRIHAIGPGIILAEIQQTSDVTYRIYDWDRVDYNGKPREMHTELAVDAIDYNFYNEYKTNYKPQKNISSEIVKSPYFTTNIIDFNRVVERDYNWLDSFVVYMALEGKTLISAPGLAEPVTIQKGETVLIPAEMKEIILTPGSGNSRLIEVYIE
jgi:mannose-6-phosphate isomerase